MSTAQKVHRDPSGSAGPRKIEFGENMADLVTSGAGRIAEAQKKSLDVAVQQNAELVDLWKKTVKTLPGAPGLFMLALEGAGFRRFAETQKTMIDLMVEQSRAIAELLNDRTTAVGKATDTVVKFARQGVERAVAAQKQVLDQAAAHSKEVVEATQENYGPDGGAVEAAADSIQRGVNAIVNAQKELLDMAVR